MKKIISIFTTIILCACLFTGCISTTPQKVDRAVVQAVVVDSGTSRGGRWIRVAYDGVVTSWDNQDLYNYYHTRHGATIQCVLVIYTYESGKTTRKLLYNEDIENYTDYTEVK